jgi:hypothetical protein
MLTVIRSLLLHMNVNKQTFKFNAQHSAEDVNIMKLLLNDRADNDGVR